MVTGTGQVTLETLQRLADAFNAHDLDRIMTRIGATEGRRAR